MRQDPIRRGLRRLRAGSLDRDRAACVRADLDHQQAEDLAQEAFTKLWFHWRKVSDGSPRVSAKIVTTTFLSARRPLDRRAPDGDAA